MAKVELKQPIVLYLLILFLAYSVRYNKNPPPYSRGVSFFMTIIIKNSLGRWISLYAVAICDSTLLSSAICFVIIICSYADVKYFPHFACVSLIIHFIRNRFRFPTSDFSITEQSLQR